MSFSVLFHFFYVRIAQNNIHSLHFVGLELGSSYYNMKMIRIKEWLYPGAKWILMSTEKTLKIASGSVVGIETSHERQCAKTLYFSLPNSLMHRSPSNPHGGSSTGGPPFGQVISWYKFNSWKKMIWAASSEFGTYRLCEQRRFMRACASAQSRQNLRCSFIQAVSQEEPSDRKPDPWPLWMAGHAQLQFVMAECLKTQICLTGLI